MINKFSSAEILAMNRAAFGIFGPAWLNGAIDGDTVCGKLRRAVSLGMDRDLATTAQKRLKVLLSLCEGRRYSLCDWDSAEEIGDATVTETVDSLMEQSGYMEVDGRECYVEFE